jgi:hypothetical protein
MTTERAPIDRPLVEVTVSAPADQVWRALREPEQIRRWFGWDADTLAAEIDYIFLDHVTVSEVDRILRFEGMADRIEVEARGEATVVRVVRPAPSADTDWDEVYDEETQGWIAFLHQLRFALERHPDDLRRTLHFLGAPRSPGDPLGAAALGLPDLPAGAPISAQVGPGDLADGVVWHRGRHQRGVTSSTWGDGLLVVMDRAPTSRWPTGTSRMILTTHGLDDAAFAALEARWSAWWSARFGPAEPAGA